MRHAHGSACCASAPHTEHAISSLPCSPCAHPSSRLPHPNPLCPLSPSSLPFRFVPFCLVFSCGRRPVGRACLCTPPPSSPRPSPLRTVAVLSAHALPLALFAGARLRAARPGRMGWDEGGKSATCPPTNVHTIIIITGSPCPARDVPTPPSSSPRWRPLGPCVCVCAHLLSFLLSNPVRPLSILYCVSRGIIGGLTAGFLGPRCAPRDLFSRRRRRAGWRRSIGQAAGRGRRRRAVFVARWGA